MLPIADTYDRLAPRVRTLAKVLHDDPDVGSVGACVRFHGQDHELRLEQHDKLLKLTVRIGRLTLYRGLLPGWYGAVERAKRESRPARKKTAA